MLWKEWGECSQGTMQHYLWRAVPAQEKEKVASYADGPLSQALCTLHGDRVLDTAKRSCLRGVARASWWRDLIPETSLRHLLRVAGWKTAASLEDLGRLFADHELLLYQEGDFFDEHVDTQRYADQVGVLLLVHRASCTSGGLLQAMGDHGVWHNIDQNTYDQEHDDTLVLLKAGTRHRVTPVNSGQRWVLKMVVRITPSPSDSAFTLWPEGTYGRGEVWATGCSSGYSGLAD